MRLLVADVKRVTGRTRHYHADGLGKDATVVQSAAPSFVEIESGDGGFFLLHYLRDGRGVADTWHLTIDEAKRQAAFEFEIGPDDWRPCPPDENFACPCCGQLEFDQRPPGTFAFLRVAPLASCCSLERRGRSIRVRHARSGPIRKAPAASCYSPNSPIVRTPPFRGPADSDTEGLPLR